MEIIKKAGATLKNSPIGAIAGAALGFWAIKKYTGVSNKIVLVGLVVASALVGSSIEYKIKAKTVKPAIAAK